ncbi:hypothetical protein AM228_23860 [Planktothricoides sp. SR001]|uniref:PAS domain S-box protein n=1 Tax=Planktothricoides sp. SR001 TaxID=1705388 RepID=UPI0006C3B27A|nr:PAS domain S-box protein [Planktothricoides sp. SR001]KOR34454.1 hypothetical protein AM228_23860 [Planktothricoides sp. SR001]
MPAIAGYKILQTIHESPNSRVYRGLRESDNQPVILKVLKEDYPTPEKIRKYKLEYLITHNLNLQRVVKSYSLETYHNTLMIVFEDFGGKSLKSLMSHRRFTLEEFLEIAIASADSLAEIHAANIIHKDVNPSNLVYNPETKVLKLIDFGIAVDFAKDSHLLETPQILEGTLSYMSPEQTGRMNRILDYRTDFYSLGVTFYELLTHQLPFKGADAMELVHCHLAKQPQPPHLIIPNNGEKQLDKFEPIPRSISDLVMKLLAKTAEERYQSAWGLKADLEFCLSQLRSTRVISQFPLGSQDISDKFLIPNKLYGRSKEIAQLLAAFEQIAGRGKTPKSSATLGNVSPVSPVSPGFFYQKARMITVTGVPGIGKSSLVAEIYKPITRKKGYFICGKFDQYQRNIPYSGVIQAFQELIRQLLTESEEQLNEWRTKTLKVLGANAQLILEVIPEFKRIIGCESVGSFLPAMQAENRLNLLFQNLIQVFANAAHPLVIFLDNLQWIDSASLKLLKLLMSGCLDFVLFIGAYRDNEVSHSHPLMLTLSELEHQGAIISSISLSPLKLKEINQLISETVKQPLEVTKYLAQVVQNKTGGNPFFVNEFLKALAADQLIYFDYQRGSWHWEINQISLREITDNVVELMASKIQKLPDSSQESLKLAACIGNHFDLGTLAMLSGKSLKQTTVNLQAAVQEGLIVPLSDRDGFLPETSLGNLSASQPLHLSQTKSIAYKFVHDRIQQAAYFLMPMKEKQAVHWQVGQFLYQNTPESDREAKIFEIVNQLNAGSEQIKYQGDRDRLAELNLTAGIKAKTAAAYELALNYLTIGITLLGVRSWQTQYELTLFLHVEAAEAAYLSGHLPQMYKFSLVVLQSAKNILDKAKVYEIKIQAYQAQNQLKEAVHTALPVLQLLGITFPSVPANSTTTAVPLHKIWFGVYQIQWAMFCKKIEDLIHLPTMTDPIHLAAIRILSTVATASYIAVPELFPLIIFKMVNLSLEYGNSPESAFAYAGYGLILSGFLGQINAGYQFGQLALNLLSKVEDRQIKAKVVQTVSIWIFPWKRHIRETLQSVRQLYLMGRETGDLEWAKYAAHTGYYSYFSSQEELTVLEQEMAGYSQILYQLNQINSFYGSELFRQGILNLMGEAANPCVLIGEAYNELKMLPVHQQAQDQTILHYFYLNKLILCYLFGNYHEARQNAKLAKKYVAGVVGTIALPVFYFYDSLIYLSQINPASQFQKRRQMQEIYRNQKQMKKWAKFAPMNYLAKFYLVEAERYRAKGQEAKAMDFYEKAIAAAKKYEYLHEEALANELAAKFYADKQQINIARTYLQNARYCYVKWGAKAKAKQLEETYPELLPYRADLRRLSATNHHGMTSLTSTETRMASALDLTTVVKASQALSGEIVLDKLLAKLITIVLENAGAQKGFLILEQNGELVIEAAGGVEDSEVSVRRSHPVEKTNLLPKSIINYVARTHEYVVFNDATKEIDSPFCKIQNPDESYILLHQPKSVLCVPIIGQGKFIGILYLENNLTPGAFTPDRLLVLRLLCSQAAISLENARLYEAEEVYSRTLEAKVQERTEELEEQIRVRAQTEAALRLSEEKFSKAFRSSPNPIVITTLAAGKFIEVNDSFLTLTGYSKQEVINQMSHHLNIWQNPQDEISIMQMLTTADSVHNQEFAWGLKSGEIRTVLLSAELINLGGEECILYLVNDITERKQAEEAIAANERKYRNLVETSQDMIWSVDAAGQFTFVNQAVKQIYGYDPEEMSQQKFTDYADPKHQYQDRQMLQEILAGESVFHYETVHRSKQGQPIYLMVNAIGVRNWQGRVVGITGTASDITYLKQAEEALRQSESQLKKAKEAADAANQAKSTFLAKMSHELRTPLNAILGFTQLMSRDHRLTPEQQEYLNIINYSGEHLLELINDVLDMSKIEAGHLELNPTSFDLFRLLNSIFEMLQLKATGKGLKFIFHCDPNVPQYVQTDESKLRQVLINLLGNAIKFTEQGMVQLSVTMVQNYEDKLHFQVQDSGPGIEPDETDDLFEPFVQTKTGRKSIEGTGLGLSISRQFVRLMGGDILVSSCLDGGTLFSFEITIRLAVAGSVKAKIPPAKIVGLAPNQPEYRILVVEDQTANRVMLTELLRSIGFQVGEAMNGIEAIALWRSWQPHLIWMDIRMPEMDGLEATQQIRQLQDPSEDPVVIIALTASIFEEEHQQILAIGCNDWVRKPFRQEVILAKIAEYLGVRYIYETKNTHHDTLTHQLSSKNRLLHTDELNADHLKAMSPQWRSQLQEAALCARDQRLFRLIDQIPPEHSPLANVLVDLVNNFRYDKIMDLIQRWPHE